LAGTASEVLFCGASSDAYEYLATSSGAVNGDERRGVRRSVFGCVLMLPLTAWAGTLPLHDSKNYPPGTVTDAGPVTYVDGYNIEALGDEVVRLSAEVARLQAVIKISATTKTAP
jgi:hypothetical protein